ncbi:MAG: hypothetical protein WC046_05950 [Candidatus Bathyarchaeia archaeon]
MLQVVQAQPVYFNSSHQLRQGTSLAVHKTNIEPLDGASWIYSLCPVTFDWKDERCTIIRSTNRSNRWGSSADFIVTNFNDGQIGKLQGVIYEKLAVSMLVELQKLRCEVDELKTKLAAYLEKRRSQLAEQTKAGNFPVMQQVGMLNLRINDMMVQLNTVIKILIETNAELKKENAGLKAR